MFAPLPALDEHFESSVPGCEVVSADCIEGSGAVRIASVAQGSEHSAAHAGFAQVVVPSKQLTLFVQPDVSNLQAPPPFSAPPLKPWPIVAQVTPSSPPVPSLMLASHCSPGSSCPLPQVAGPLPVVVGPPVSEAPAPVKPVEDSPEPLQAPPSATARAEAARARSGRCEVASLLIGRRGN